MNRKLLLLLLLLSLMLACEDVKKDQPIATPVRVRVVEEYKTGNETRYTANIQPRHEVHLAFKSSGYVEDLLQVRDADGVSRDIQSGDFIKRGTVLARLRKVDFETRVQQARAHLGQAQAAAQNSASELDRAIKLYESESLTKSDYDAANARAEESLSRVEAARAQLQEAEIALRDSDLRAPLDAVVIQRSLEAGDLATPGTAAFILADTTSVKGVFGVPDVLISRFKIGQKMAVLLEAIPGTEFQGVITRISPAADQRNRLFETEVSIPNPENRLKAGMIASIVVRPFTGSTVEHVLVIPLTSVVSAKKSDHYAVMVVASQEGKKIAQLREITLGETFGDRIAVKDGLRQGEEVITVGATLVEAGDPVSVIP